MQVARILAVSKQSASRWHAAWERGGTVALASKGPTGVRPRLSDADLERIERRCARVLPRMGSPEICGPCGGLPLWWSG